MQQPQSNLGTVKNKPGENSNIYNYNTKCLPVFGVGIFSG